MDDVGPDAAVRSAFKRGFLWRCAEEGLGPDAVDRRVAAAEALVRGRLDKRANWLTDPLWTAGAIGAGGLALGLGSAYLGGGLAGNAAARAARDAIDPAEVRRLELIAAYNAYADEIARHNRRRPASPGGAPSRTGPAVGRPPGARP